MLSDEVLSALDVSRTDRTLWSPSCSVIPRNPRTQLASMNGVEKEYIGRHADVLLMRFFERSQHEEDLGRLFRQGVLNKLKCNLLNIPYADKKGWRSAQWESFWKDEEAIPWRRVFTEYIRPLGTMMRAFSTVYQKRADLMENGKLDLVIKEYISGAIVVLGAEFVAQKTIFHRLRHLLPQCLGKYLMEA